MNLAKTVALIGMTVVALTCVSTNGADIAIGKITGVYSNMRFNPDSGDVSGIELFLVNTRKGLHVVFQDAEGVPSVPVVTTLQAVGNNIEFTLPDRVGYSGKFVGRFTLDGIEGRFINGAVSNDGPSFKLRKSCSYWQISTSNISCNKK